MLKVYDTSSLMKGVSEVAYKINEECISCGICESECPVNAISAGDDIYIIDADLCTDCGACADVCPVSAPNKE